MSSLKQKLAMSRKSWKQLFRNPALMFVFLFLLIDCLFVAILIFWGLSTSLKGIDDFMENMVFLPKKFEWKNYAFAFRYFSMPLVNQSGVRQVYLEEMFFNSCIFSIGGSLVGAFCSCWMAYLTQRYRYKFSHIVYTGVLIVMIIPITGGNVGMIKVMSDLHLFGTWPSWMIMKFGFVNMYYLVFYAAFRGIPRDYEESAFMDGAGNFRIFLSILLPMVSSTFLTVFLLNFIGYWNDYMTPLIFLPEKYTISRGIYALSVTSINAFNRTPMKMATSYMCVIPMVILFVVFRERMMQSMSLGGLKE